MAGITNTLSRPVNIEELLAPHDRENKKAAMEQRIPITTNRQRAIAFNKNLPNSDAVEVKTVAGFIPFRNKVPMTNNNHSAMFNLPHTTLPHLTRKPPKPGLSIHQADKRPLHFSPIAEQSTSPGQQQASKVQCNKPDNYTFREEVQIDQT